MRTPHCHCGSSEVFKMFTIVSLEGSMVSTWNTGNHLNFHGAWREILAAVWKNGPMIWHGWVWLKNTETVDFLDLHTIICYQNISNTIKLSMQKFQKGSGEAHPTDKCSF